MPPSKESLYAPAIAEIEEGASIRAVARKYGLARTTLQDRLRGAQPKAKSRELDQHLSPEQEYSLGHWILHEDASGRGPSLRMARRMAQAILAEAGESRLIGNNWVYRYLKRNPWVKIKPSDLLERSRARGSTKEAFKRFFDLLEAKIKERNILLRNLANIDEYGL
jgi:transposase-like protein